MSTFELTEAQREFFATFGFLHLPGLFAEESTRIEDAFEELIRSRGGDGHDGRQRLSVAPFLNHSEYLCSLLDDERLDGIARAFAGTTTSTGTATATTTWATPPGTPTARCPTRWAS